MCCACGGGTEAAATFLVTVCKWKQNNPVWGPLIDTATNPSLHIFESDIGKTKVWNFGKYEPVGSNSLCVTSDYKIIFDGHSESRFQDISTSGGASLSVDVSGTPSLTGKYKFKLEVTGTTLTNLHSFDIKVIECAIDDWEPPAK